jgi:hypothetical protein
MRQYLFKPIVGLLLVGALFLAGCGAKNAEEFRRMIGTTGTHLVTNYDVLEVDHPYTVVADRLRKKTDECLNVTVKVICTNCIGKSDKGSQIWTPTFISTAERTEVHLQLKRTDLIDIGAPPMGNYELVLDATPAGKKSSRIEIYRLRPQTSFIQKAMLGWVRGEARGCPDLSSTQ